MGGKPAIICYELHTFKAIPWDICGVGLFEMRALKSPNNKTLLLSLKFEISSVSRFHFVCVFNIPVLPLGGM